MYIEKLRDGQTVMVVDDESDILTMLCSLLDDEGYTSVCLQHPQDAVALDGNCPPALCFVDLMMPCMSGISLAQRLRETGYAETPMIAMSASDAMLASAERSHLFQAVLPKPFDLSQFMGFVEQYAGLQQAS